MVSECEMVFASTEMSGLEMQNVWNNVLTVKRYFFLESLVYDNNLEWMRDGISIELAKNTT